MEFSDVIILLSSFLVILGWYINSHFNRKQEIANLRSSHRIETLKTYLLFYTKAQESKSLDGFNDIQVSFLLYGYQAEIDLVNKIASTIVKNPQSIEYHQLLITLNILARNNLRKELGLPLVED